MPLNKKAKPPLADGGRLETNFFSNVGPINIAIHKAFDKLLAIVADGIAWRLSLYTLAMPAREARP